MSENPRDDKRYWLDRPGSVRLLLWLLYAVCAALLLLDFVYHRHVLHSWEGLWGFYAVFGFAAYVALVLGAKEMRKFLMRDEDYYDDR